MDCSDEFPQFLSPVAVFANRLLNADLSVRSNNKKNNKNDEALAGLLMRTADYFALDNITQMVQHLFPPGEMVPQLKYAPSSYLHASIRAPGAIFQNIVDKEKNKGDYTLLFGTKFDQNTAFKEFQKGDKKAITVDFAYPHDAATVNRGTVFDKKMCLDFTAREKAMLCVDGECLANGPGACGGCKVKPGDFGDFLARYTDINGRLIALWDESCYYDTIADTVTASNSMWDTRRRWSATVDQPTDYQGYNECAASLNIDDMGMADAIVLTLHRTEEVLPQSVCHFPNHSWLHDRLQLAYEKGHGDLPVLFYKETNGIHSIKDCVTVFGGDNCDDAWQKEFFSQEYSFIGACLHKPPGCDEVYYFPADGEKCSAHTEMGKERVERLCREEKNQDARLAYEKFMKPKQRTFTKKEIKEAETQRSSQRKAAHESRYQRISASDADIVISNQSPTTNSTIGIESSPAGTINGGDKYVVSSSTIVMQGLFNVDGSNHVLFFLVGLIVAFLLRAKVEVVDESQNETKAIRQQ